MSPVRLRGRALPGNRRLRVLSGVVLVAVVLVVIVAGGSGGSDKSSQKGGSSSGSSDPNGGAISGGKGVPHTLRELAARLPLDRQVSQLFLVGFSGADQSADFFNRLRTRDWGGAVLTRENYVNVQQLTELASAVTSVAQSVGHVPPLVAAAQTGGAGTAFPDLPPKSEPSLGKTGKPSAARSQAAQAGATLRTLGINTVLAPDADVTVEGGHAEGRSFGADPRLVSQFTRAALAGWAQTRVAAIVGHFPGQGAASQDPDVGPATVGGSLDDLSKRDLMPFATVARQAPAVLVSNAQYAAFDGVTPAVLLPDAIGGVLRQKLGFTGVVVCGDLGATAHITGESIGRVAVDALRSGCDLLYLEGGANDQQSAYASVLAAARSGRLPRLGIQASLFRILQLKGRYGMITQAGAP